MTPSQQPEQKHSKPVDDIKALTKEWERLKSIVKDTDCGGMTIEFLSEDCDESSTALHTMWRGLQDISELCSKINDRLNLQYEHSVAYVAQGVTMQQAAELEDTLSKLLDQNARIGGELKRAKEEIFRLNGEHDEQVRKEERENVLDKIEKFVDDAKTHQQQWDDGQKYSWYHQMLQGISMIRTRKKDGE